jgi:phosphoribosylformylglycinamidine synthase
LIRELIAAGRVTAVHDISDGGPLVAIAEMALASNLGAELDGNVSGHPDRAFAEDQGRYIITARPGALEGIVWKKSVYPAGKVGGCSLAMPVSEVSLADLRAAHEGFFPKLMGSALTPEA